MSRHAKSIILAVPILVWNKYKGPTLPNELHSLLTPPFLSSASPYLPMEQQGTLKFSKVAAANLGSLRPIVAQQTARYDVAKKCVCSFDHPSLEYSIFLIFRVQRSSCMIEPGQFLSTL